MERSKIAVVGVGAIAAVSAYAARGLSTVQRRVAMLASVALIGYGSYPTAAAVYRNVTGRNERHGEAVQRLLSGVPYVTEGGAGPLTFSFKKRIKKLLNGSPVVMSHNKHGHKIILFKCRSDRDGQELIFAVHGSRDKRCERLFEPSAGMPWEGAVIDERGQPVNPAYSDLQRLLGGETRNGYTLAGQ